jgi:hypothetical protein
MRRKSAASDEPVDCQMGVVHMCGLMMSFPVGYRLFALLQDRPQNVCCDPAFSEAFERPLSDDHVFQTSCRAFLSIASP